MIFIQFYSIVLICCSLYVHAGDQSVIYDDDVYFEVLEPRKFYCDVVDDGDLFLWIFS